MKYLNLATNVSNQSYANIFLSHFALPRNAQWLEEIAKTFDTSDTRYGVWVIETRNTEILNITTPLCVMMGDYQTVVRAAICLQPIADLYYHAKNKRHMLEDYVNIIRVATSFDFMEMKHRDDGQYMSFAEFVASRTAVAASALNSDYTGDDEDNEDHIKGFLYGEEFYKILITECDHTDLMRVKYDGLSFDEEDQDEVEAVAYRCYVNSKGYYHDDALRSHFERPLGKRRVSLTR